MQALLLLKTMDETYYYHRYVPDHMSIWTIRIPIDNFFLIM